MLAPETLGVTTLPDDAAGLRQVERLVRLRNNADVELRARCRR